MTCCYCRTDDTENHYLKIIIKRKHGYVNGEWCPKRFNKNGEMDTQ